MKHVLIVYLVIFVFLGVANGRRSRYNPSVTFEKTEPLEIKSSRYVPIDLEQCLISDIIYNCYFDNYDMVITLIAWIMSCTFLSFLILRKIQDIRKYRLSIVAVEEIPELESVLSSIKKDLKGVKEKDFILDENIDLDPEILKLERKRIELEQDNAQLEQENVLSIMEEAETLTELFLEENQSLSKACQDQKSKTQLVRLISNSIARRSHRLIEMRPRNETIKIIVENPHLATEQFNSLRYSLVPICSAIVILSWIIALCRLVDIRYLRHMLNQSNMRLVEQTLTSLFGAVEAETKSSGLISQAWYAATDKASLYIPWALDGLFLVEDLFGFVLGGIYQKIHDLGTVIMGILFIWILGTKCLYVFVLILALFAMKSLFQLCILFLPGYYLILLVYTKSVSSSAFKSYLIRDCYIASMIVFSICVGFYGAHIDPLNPNPFHLNLIDSMSTLAFFIKSWIT